MYQSDLRCKNHDEECFGICTNNDCMNERLTCTKCLKYFHTSHLDDIIDIKQYEQQKHHSSKIKEQIYQTLNLISQMKDNLDQLLKIFKFVENPGLNYLDAEVIQMNKCALIQSQISQSLIQFDKTFQTANYELIQCLQTIKVLGKQENQQILGNQLDKFYFSNIEKHEYVVVSKNGLQAEGYHSCICQPVIAQNTNKKFAFKVLRIGLLQTLFIGVCIKEQVKLSNYIPSITMMGHGLYVITQQGFCYSNHQQQKNDVQLSFEFMTNDIITIEVDNQNHFIIWKKIQSGETFVMELQKQQDYHPVVYLGGYAGVQIMNQIE